MNTKISKLFLSDLNNLYFWASRFVPKQSRDDVFKLYNFVNMVNNFVDQSRPDVENFEYIENRFANIKEDLAKRIVPSPLDDSHREQALAGIAYVIYRYRCDADWVDAFLRSKRLDMQKRQYRSLKDLNEYLYGSSEVIALILARILNIVDEAFAGIRTQARAVAYLQLISNLGKDLEHGRHYFAETEYKKFGLKTLSKSEATAKAKMFADFVHAQLLRYARMQLQANEVQIYIPKRLKLGLQTYIDSNTYTASAIKNNPMLVFVGKTPKPSRRQVISSALVHGIKR